MLTYAQNVNRDLSGALLRLHILANSDGADDQALKIAVRDRVLNETASLFQNAASAADAARIAEENADFIKSAAEDEIRRRGFDYPVAVSLETALFPTKRYGCIALPRGRYHALRILIGDAAGANWWCVMYPPLCFIDGVAETDGESLGALLGSVGSDNYELITGDGAAVKIKFKIAELWGGLIEN